MPKKTLLDKSNQNEDAVRNNDDSMDDDEEPNFSDPEGYVDDISDEGESPQAERRPDHLEWAVIPGMAAYGRKCATLDITSALFFTHLIYFPPPPPLP